MIERAFWQVLILFQVVTVSPWLRSKSLPTDVALANEMSSFHSQEEIWGNHWVVHSFLFHSCHKPGTSQDCSAFSFQKLLLQQSWGKCMKELCDVEMRNHLLKQQDSAYGDRFFFSYELFLQEIYQRCDFRAFKSLREDSGAQFGSTNIKTGTAPVQGWQKICQVSHMFDMDGPGALDSIQSEVSQRKINIVY